MYHDINETAARRAKEANSYRDYKEGSATAEYRAAIDKVIEIAELQKKSVAPIHHEKIDRLLETYTRKLAAWYNKHFEIEARVPSIMIAGGSNFQTAKKHKQNAARQKHNDEWNYIQGLIDRIKGTGTGGISSDDPDAIDQLREKLANLEQSQETMKAINAYYKKNKTLDGCDVEGVTQDMINKLKASMSRSWRGENAVPFESWTLSNNNANIKRVRQRISELEKRAESPPDGWTFYGGEVVVNTGENRLQVIFDGKPDEDIRAALKSQGFRWAPSQKAWQRQLTTNAIWAAKRIEAIQPLKMVAIIH